MWGTTRTRSSPLTAPLRVAVSSWEDYPARRIENYRQRLREAGLEPADFREPGPSLDACAGLLLTGGVDVDPALYGEEPHPKTQEPDPARDAFELSLVQGALARDLPVLAICRGHQLLNVALGGSLLQHVESGSHRSHGAPDWESRWHAVSVDPQSRLAGILGEEAVVVNSRHHQALTPDGLAPGLKAAALSDDGLVEALESRRHGWVFGIQWHPERLEPQTPSFAALSRRLFAAFADAIVHARV